ncbi:ExbD/TolR family protein [Tropicibacter oceani]|uniref:Biopolymer transporter ExbD n=1 Tax=Tropicibacter oceani TaxID=3058420 RepID=A0ABY8QHB7_9RHOB|nr:biopolymer transporter ExbD [Tropicibacter oceani]WGW03368.1 biopolymer transporter ExbD [Tropicibacter oceani]
MLDLPTRPQRRRPSLTPMIDVVFLLLVFFMLAARFGAPLAQPLHLAGSGGEAWQGPPRLITLRPDQTLLNGQPVTDLPAALAPLMKDPTDTIILRSRDGADVQRLVDTLTALRAAGMTNLAVVE